MTRIRFYSNADDRVQAAAAWLAASWRQHPVLVFAPDAELAERLDRALWTTPAIGFLPHCRAASPLAAETPVLITDSLETLPQDRCLLNLSHDVPPGFSRFEELVEIVSTADGDRLPARERYRFYRERGYAVENRTVADGF
ncbi:MAG: DNA polymerase III subunit chi [Rhodocyclaceae bacterium]|nr:DNA polymerase III subunit chi [Rhodocyclaceae bacterium]